MYQIFEQVGEKKNHTNSQYSNMYSNWLSPGNGGTVHSILQVHADGVIFTSLGVTTDK